VPIGTNIPMTVVIAPFESRPPRAIPHAGGSSEEIEMTNHKQTTARRAGGISTTKNASGRNRPSTTRSPGRPPASGRQKEAPPVWWKRAPILGTAVVLIAVAATLIGVLGGSPITAPSHGGGGKATATVTGPAGPEGVPLEQGPMLAPASTAATGQTVDGVQCDSNEQVAYHVHTHLSVYVNGQLRPLPAGIGIVLPVAQQTANGPFDGASQCYYWLHVHAQDGVIHIESPSGHSYTLGQFFDIWRQPLSTDQVGPATGATTVFVNGVLYRGNPRKIALGSHVDIQIDVGTPVVAPKSVNWSLTSL
jgi:hypothetical protein